MKTSKMALSGLAILALTVGGVAQAETIRAGASLPSAKAAKLSRKTAKKGVELNAADSTVPIVLGVAGVAAGVGIGVAVTRKSP